MMKKIHMKKWIRSQLLIYLFLVVMIACGGYGVMSAALGVPDNPMSGQTFDLDGNIKPLNYDGEEDETVYIPLTVQSDQNADSQQLTKTDDAVSPEEPQDGDKADDTKNDQNQTSSSPKNKQSTATSSGTGGTGGSTEGGGISDPTKYFYTTIDEEKILTDTAYYFEIHHKISSLTVKEVRVYVNDVLQIQFNGNVLLKEGNNTIRVVVDYIDANGKLLSPFKSYPVKVDTKSLVINTDLVDGQSVTSSYLTFHASATYLGNEAELTVKQDGAVITGSDGVYDVTLKEGENVFDLYAASNGRNKEGHYTVTYENSGIFDFDTTLKNHTVHKSSYSFRASLKNPGKNPNFAVTINGVKVKGNGDFYSVNLAYGNNRIRLVGSSQDNPKIEKEYIVRYEPEEASDDNPIPDPEHAPFVKMNNLSDGMSTSSSIFTMEIQSVDYKGNRIYANNITVLLNGVVVNSRGEDGTTTTYRLENYAENNTVTIKLKDTQGFTAQYPLHFTYTDPEGASIGKITLSIEATTVGLGYLVAPVPVDIYDKETLATVIDQVLKENGFTYTVSNSGTTEIPNYYVAHILKEGIAKNAKIPEDLLAVLTEDEQPTTTNYDENSLGEFDFYQSSGWMYQINGDCPNYGISMCYPANGDVIRFRFTLALGKDVGCAEGADGSEINYDKEW